MLFSSYMDSDNATHYKKRSDYKDQNITEIEQPEELSDLTEKSNEQTLSSQEPRKKKLFLIGAIVTGVVIISVVSFFLSQKKDISKPQKSPEPTVAATLTPTASPKAAFDRSEWNLEILNGSGVTGAAKKLADQLINLGYKVIKTGNADRDDYQKTQISVQKSLFDKVNLVVADLKDAVKIASVAGELKNSTASGRIIIGKE